MQNGARGRNGILIGLIWSVIAWVIFFANYAGTLAGVGSVPLNIGFWLVENLIYPISAVLARYLNAFVWSVLIGAVIGWLTEIVILRFLMTLRRRVIFYRASGQRKAKRNRYRIVRRHRD